MGGVWGGKAESYVDTVLMYEVLEERKVRMKTKPNQNQLLQAWWSTPMIPLLGRWRQEDHSAVLLREFKASLGYRKSYLKNQK